jgi:hypothetical protein
MEKFITKNTKSGSHRTHVANSKKRNQPVCGGGNSARSAQWQEVFTEPNCKRCLTIIERSFKNESQ